MITLLILAIAGIAQTMALPSTKYMATGECEDDKACLYSYSAEQQFGENETSLTVDVEIMCHSVGTFKDSSATQYCMAVSDSQLNGNSFNVNSDMMMKNFKTHVDQTLSGWFCFVQTEDGKIAAVQHSTNESDIAVNIKKSIAAAFQANFKGTEEEVESDLQSEHIAHYRFEADGSGNQKMHRHIENDDVISYSSGAKKNRFHLVKDEDVDYRQGIMQHSSGSILVEPQNIQNEGKKEMSVSKALSSRGSYTMDLQQCYTPAKHRQSRQRRGLNRKMSTSIIEEDLKAKIDTVKFDQEEMAYIRENKILSVAKALRELHQNPHNKKLMKQLKSLLVMEYQYGTVEGYPPALTDVIDYLQMIQLSAESSDVQMRNIIYNMLSAEGSLKSQMVLLESLQMVTSTKERRAIIKEISTIENAHMEFVNALHNLLTSGVESEDTNLLLISFGGLASRARPEVRIAITQFLIQMEATIDNANTLRLVNLLLAMGSTGSDDVIDVVLQYVSDPRQHLQMAAISALVKFTSNVQVLNQLTEELQSDPPRDTLVAILQTLMKGREYAIRMDIDISMGSNHPILSTLISAVLKTNDTTLVNHVAQYIRKVGGEQSSILLDQLYPRVRRGAAWDDTSNPHYDCIAIPYSRSYDASAFPKHSAYLHHKEIGNSDVNLTVTAGVFIGMSNNCGDMMSFARVCVDGNIFSESRYIADAEAWVEKSGSRLEGNAYFSVAEGTPEVYEHTTYSCFSYDNEFNQLPEHLYDITLNLFLYVGYVSYTISVELGYDVSFDDQLCPDLVEIPNELISSITGVVMSVSMSLDGSGTYTFIDFFRASLTVDADLSYQVEPRGSSVVCAQSCSSGQYQSCAAMYEEWPDNSIRLSARTQMKQLEWCYRSYSWFSVPYPCFRWGSWTTYHPMSYTWSSNANTNTVSMSCNPSTSACATTVAPL